MELLPSLLSLHIEQSEFAPLFALFATLFAPHAQIYTHMRMHTCTHTNIYGEKGVLVSKKSKNTAEYSAACRSILYFLEAIAAECQFCPGTARVVEAISFMLVP
jgi:hypothetical protein